MSHRFLTALFTVIAVVLLVPPAAAQPAEVPRLCLEQHGASPICKASGTSPRSHPWNDRQRSLAKSS